jgi:hypothetical protein
MRPPAISHNLDIQDSLGITSFASFELLNFVVIIHIQLLLMAFEAQTAGHYPIQLLALRADGDI